ADVVVIAAGGHEQRARVAPDHDVKPEHPVVEGFGLGDVGHLKMDVADDRPGRRERLEAIAAAKLLHDAVEIERERGHLELAAAMAPLLPGTVAVYLDPVAVGIGEVESLADEMIGCAVQRPPVLDQAREREREVATGGEENREVIEPGRAAV